MIFTEASVESVASFLLVVFLVLTLISLGGYYAYKKNIKKASLLGLGLLFWILLTSIYVKSGIFEALPVASIPLFFGTINLSAILFGLSSVGKTFAKNLPLPALVGFQGFRFPLELVLHSWAVQGTIPETMTWTGLNFDIISGILALVLAPFSRKSKRVAWVFNGVGLILLLNVMRVAVLSSPLPMGWPVHPSLQLAYYLPYAWIGPVCVAGALAGHVILTRALMKN